MNINFPETIKRAAREAADSSIDAHGGLVEVRKAYEVIRNIWWDSENIVDRYDSTMLPDGLPSLFAIEYVRYGKSIGGRFV